MTTEEIKSYIYNNKICVVTNSISLPSTLLLPSLKTYIEYLPIQNFWIIPGFLQNKLCYGLSAFLYMIQYMLQFNNFDYVIYLDEDVFIKDFSLLIEEFDKFKKQNCCLAGIQDGSLLWHRNHSKYLINTFISFWNIKQYRESNISIEDITLYINSHKESTFKNWFIDIKENNQKLFEKIKKYAGFVSKQAENYRKIYLKDNNFESEYASIVRNDNRNKIENKQEPYTSDDEIAINNFEPYYILEQYLINKTNSPIYYLFATDFTDKEYKGKCDTSGLTTAVRSPNDNKIIAVHTWFSRAYTKWPQEELQVIHTRRINSIIKQFSKI